MDLSPAKWIWLPSERTLCNTFVCFRTTLEVTGELRSAEINLLADSRFLLTVNGVRVLWGPAPSDPRYSETDCADLMPYLHSGKNAIAVRVLYYGNGEGTWVAGNPGLIARIRWEDAAGRQERVSDRNWRCQLDRAHVSGGPRRAYHRSLSEVWDARLESDWESADFDDSKWLSAMELSGPADKPSLCNGYADYLTESGPQMLDRFELRSREMPPMREEVVFPKKLMHAGTVEWLADPEDWFRYRIPDSFRIQQGLSVEQSGDVVEFQLPMDGKAVYLVFEFSEEMVGFPFYSMEAPEGTQVDLFYQEAHDPEKTLWLDSAFYRVTRTICRAGLTDFTAFEYEALRFIQLHIQGEPGARIRLHKVGLLRRVYPFPECRIECSDPILQKVFDANVNTLLNSAQDILVDGMARERQQYGGDCGHQLEAIRYAFGPQANTDRYFRTYSDGITWEGYFLDCWPCGDRMRRMGQRQLGITAWGVLLDHGVGFILDAYRHYVETGRVRDAEKSFRAGMRFVHYLEKIQEESGLLPVEGMGVPTVWLDHDAYTRQRHKQCCFNLYVVGMLREAYCPFCELFGESEEGEHAAALADRLLGVTVRRFWDESRGLFVDNLPWLAEEGELHISDRTLATAVLYSLVPGGNLTPSLDCLEQCPPEMGLSYPTNAVWQLRALAENGRLHAVLRDLRERWGKLTSIWTNNTIQEYWTVDTDSSDEWSHCAVAPLLVAYTAVAGIRPLEPGFRKFRIRPQLADLERIRLTARTVQGDIGFSAVCDGNVAELEITIPEGCEGILETKGENRLLLPGTHCLRVLAQDFGA